MKGDITDILNNNDTRKILNQIIEKYIAKKDVKKDVYDLAEKISKIFAKVEGYFFMVTSEGCIKSEKEIIKMFIPKYYKACMQYLKENC